MSRIFGTDISNLANAMINTTQSTERAAACASANQKLISTRKLHQGALSMISTAIGGASSAGGNPVTPGVSIGTGNLSIIDQSGQQPASKTQHPPSANMISVLPQAQSAANPMRLSGKGSIFNSTRVPADLKVFITQTYLISQLAQHLEELLPSQAAGAHTSPSHSKGSRSNLEKARLRLTA